MIPPGIRVGEGWWPDSLNPAQRARGVTTEALILELLLGLEFPHEPWPTDPWRDVTVYGRAPTERERTLVAMASPDDWAQHDELAALDRDLLRLEVEIRRNALFGDGE